jgi:hypothetical protein
MTSEGETAGEGEDEREAGYDKMVTRVRFGEGRHGDKIEERQVHTV